MKLYVGNLPFSTREQDLKDFFSNYSSVTKVQLVTDRETGKSKGFGFVELDNNEEASNAIQELNGKQLGGRAVIVNEARPREARPPRENRSFDNRRRR